MTSDELFAPRCALHLVCQTPKDYTPLTPASNAKNYSAKTVLVCKNLATKLVLACLSPTKIFTVNPRAERVWRATHWFNRHRPAISWVRLRSSSTSGKDLQPPAPLACPHLRTPPIETDDVSTHLPVVTDDIGEAVVQPQTVQTHSVGNVGERADVGAHVLDSDKRPRRQVTHRIQPGASDAPEAEESIGPRLILGQGDTGGSRNQTERSRRKDSLQRNSRSHPRLPKQTR